MISLYHCWLFVMVFEAFDASMYNVDFSVNQTIEFTATFSKQVTWEVHIVGQQSGAEKGPERRFPALRGNGRVGRNRREAAGSNRYRTRGRHQTTDG